MKLRKILATALACCIVCGALTAVGEYQLSYEITANAADVLYSGKCGDNATWAIDSEGKMTISGEGTVSRPTEWDNAETRNCVVSLVIEEGVSELNGSTFSYFENL